MTKKQPEISRKHGQRTYINYMMYGKILYYVAASHSIMDTQRFSPTWHITRQAVNSTFYILN
jgi:hypothetical protein